MPSQADLMLSAPKEAPLNTRTISMPVKRGRYRAGDKGRRLWPLCPGRSQSRCVRVWGRFGPDRRFLGSSHQRCSPMPSEIDTKERENDANAPDTKLDTDDETIAALHE